MIFFVVHKHFIAQTNINIMLNSYVYYLNKINNA